MQEKQVAGTFLEIFIIGVVLGLLAAVAVPHAGQMTSQSRLVSREAEFQKVHAAVREMLDDSCAGTLEAAGPTADMRRVRTTDTPPLVLTDYLPGVNECSVRLGCVYSFTADGTVNQIIP